MHKNQVREPGDALAYITDCTLATICDLAGKKSRPKAEFTRQKMIAQTAIDWIQQMKIDFSNTRIVEVIEAGGVDAWAQTFYPKTNSQST